MAWALPGVVDPVPYPFDEEEVYLFRNTYSTKRYNFLKRSPIVEGKFWVDILIT